MFILKLVLISTCLYILSSDINWSCIIGLLLTIIDWLIEGKKEIVVIQEKKS